LRIESKRTIEIDEFVPKKEIDEPYLNSPYFLAPDGEVGQQAFAVIREAIRKEGMVALGRVVFTSREHVITLEPRGKGLIGFTLRYPYEVRKEEEYFDEIPDEKIPKDMLEVNMTILLAFLAPDLVQAAIAGRLPHGMGVARLADMPAEWSRQHQMLGLPSG
jgi:DNA end-binding protein Ku